jgi:hypothetical protein
MARFVAPSPLPATSASSQRKLVLCLAAPVPPAAVTSIWSCLPSLPLTKRKKKKKRRRRKSKMKGKKRKKLVCLCLCLWFAALEQVRLYDYNNKLSLLSHTVK